MEALRDQSRLMSVNATIEMIFESENPFAPYCLAVGRERNKFPGVVEKEGIEFTGHGLAPFRGFDGCGMASGNTGGEGGGWSKMRRQNILALMNQSWTWLSWGAWQGERVHRPGGMEETYWQEEIGLAQGDLEDEEKLLKKRVVLEKQAKGVKGARVLLRRRARGGVDMAGRASLLGTTSRW